MSLATLLVSADSAKDIAETEMRGTVLDPSPGFEEANRVQRFWTEHYAEFRARFPDRFVAISRTTNEDAGNW